MYHADIKLATDKCLEYNKDSLGEIFKNIFYHPVKMLAQTLVLCHNSSEPACYILSKMLNYVFQAETSRKPQQTLHCRKGLHSLAQVPKLVLSNDFPC